MERTNITPEEAIDQVFQYGGKILNKDVETISRNAEKVKGIFGKVRNLAGYVKDIGSVLSLLNDSPRQLVHIRRCRGESLPR